MGAKDLEMTAGNRGSNGVGSGLDTVSDQFMPGIVESIDPLNENPVRPGSLDVGSHRNQTEREVAHLRIASGVEDLALTACQNRPQQGRLGRAH